MQEHSRSQNQRIPREVRARDKTWDHHSDARLAQMNLSSNTLQSFLVRILACRTWAARKRENEMLQRKQLFS